MLELSRLFFAIFGVMLLSRQKFIVTKTTTDLQFYAKDALSFYAYLSHVLYNSYAWWDKYAKNGSAA